MIKKALVFCVILFSLSSHLFAQASDTGIFYDGEYTGVTWLIDADDVVSPEKSWWEAGNNNSKSSYADYDFSEEDLTEIAEAEEITEASEDTLNNQTAYESEDEKSSEKKSADDKSENKKTESKKQKLIGTIDELDEEKHYDYFSHEGIEFDTFSSCFRHFLVGHDGYWKEVYPVLCDSKFEDVFRKGIVIKNENADEYETKASPENPDAKIIDITCSIVSSYLKNTGTYKKFISPEIKPASKKSLYEMGYELIYFSDYSDVQSVTVCDLFALNDMEQGTPLIGIITLIDYIDEDTENAETQISIFWYKKTDKGYRIDRIQNGMKEPLFYTIMLGQY